MMSTQTYPSTHLSMHFQYSNAHGSQLPAPFAAIRSLHFCVLDHGCEHALWHTFSIAALGSTGSSAYERGGRGRGRVAWGREMEPRGREGGREGKGGGAWDGWVNKWRGGLTAWLGARRQAAGDLESCAVVL